MISTTSITGAADSTAGSEDTVCAVDAVVVSRVGGLQDSGEVVVGEVRIGVGTFTSRYAGVMLLHPFLRRVGAAGVLSGGVWSFSVPL